MQLPPGGRHFDQEALVAEVVIHLPVVIGAGIRPEDLVAEPRITATGLAYLLLCSCELLQNLLIDTARRPRRIQR